MINFEGYIVPLLNPIEMLKFTTENNIYINIDTTHYAQIGIDISEAAQILRERVKTVHLSDFSYPKAHVFVGEGTLDLKSFINHLDITKLHAATLECNIEYYEDDNQKTIERLVNARSFIQSICN